MEVARIQRRYRMRKHNRSCIFLFYTHLGCFIDGMIIAAFVGENTVRDNAH